MALTAEYLELTGMHLAGQAMTMALMQMLVRKGILSSDDAREVGEQALLYLEQKRGAMPEAVMPAIDLARQLLARDK